MAAVSQYAGVVRYPDGGGVAPGERARRERVRLEAAVLVQDGTGDRQVWGRRGRTPVVTVTGRAEMDVAEYVTPEGRQRPRGTGIEGDPGCDGSSGRSVLAGRLASILDEQHPDRRA
jgi:hypothetical protein